MHRNSYSLRTVCESRRLCELLVHTPLLKGDIDMGAQNSGPNGDPKSGWLIGYGLPIIAMKGYNIVPPEGMKTVRDWRAWAQGESNPVKQPDVIDAMYHTHHESMVLRDVAGDAETVLRQATEFMATHHLVGDVTVRARRLGHLGDLAVAAAQTEADTGIPSVGFATAIGTLPDLASAIARAHA